MQLVIPTFLGALVGACFLVHIGDKAFQAILAVVICAVVVMSNLRKDILGKPPATPPENSRGRVRSGSSASPSTAASYRWVSGSCRYSGLRATPAWTPST